MSLCLVIDTSNTSAKHNKTIVNGVFDKCGYATLRCVNPIQMSPTLPFTNDWRQDLAELHCHAADAARLATDRDGAGNE